MQSFIQTLKNYFLLVNSKFKSNKLKNIVIKLGIFNLSLLAKKQNIKLSYNSEFIDLRDNNNVVRLSKKHWFYGNDILRGFNYYFNSVKPINNNGFKLVDFSTPRFHEVNGFNLMPIFFPSFCEPMSTNDQYLDFANLSSGSVVLDLGAYSGLTSILFKELVGQSGKVIAVDADKINLESIKKNFYLYSKISGNNIDIVEGAIWNHCDGLSFSSEGNMGSSASDIVGDHRGDNALTKSYTLSKLAEIFNLEKVDFIKCDIEGAEQVIFEDSNFFFKFKPRIIIECHNVDGTSTEKKCLNDLSKYGYSFKNVEQTGTDFPLVECFIESSQ
ncbi:FkbM family methyltransferase [Gammaproteobacteria bacterium]|nr:FkbM family methyltransferase [Gammaproteobacteria bacterium]